MRRGIAILLSVVSMHLAIVLGIIFSFSGKQFVTYIIFAVYVPVALILNYFQRCPNCGAWPSKGSFFHEYCPRCGAHFSDE